MAADEGRDEKEREPLRVTDRRRVTETGEARDSDGAETGPASEGTVAPPTPEAAPESVAERPGSEARPEPPPTGPDQLGIASVFLAFAQNAMINLGAGVDPSGQRTPVDLAAAQESIELLRILQEKTRGNLTREEESVLGQLLHESRMAYVQVARGSGPDAEGGS